MKHNIFLLFIMIFFHIIDDFLLQSQSVLGTMKQKNWWKENSPNKLYRYDYIIALIMHAFSWSFMIMLPIAVILQFDISSILYLYITNAVIHGIVDHIKANCLKINLITDQIIHLFQIFGTYYICISFL